MKYLLYFSILLSPISVFAQAFPDDLVVSVSAGGVDPWSSYIAITIEANGEAQFARQSTGFDEVDVVPELFTLSSESIERIWNAVQTNNFFELDSFYQDENVNARDFALLSVYADGQQHFVLTRNIQVFQFDLILSVINGELPEEASLSYDITPFIPIINFDPCFLRGFGKDHDHSTSTSLAVKAEVAKLPNRLSSIADQDADHPGSVVYTETTLTEAIQNEKAWLRAKGGFTGDIIQLAADNRDGIPSDDIKATLYLDFWGSGATLTNCNAVEESIEKRWSKQGIPVEGGTIDFTTTVRSNCQQSATFAPGQPGYHQIELVDASTEDLRSHVIVPPLFDVNKGTTTGRWATRGEDLEKMFAHEAGHLLGFDDGYDDWYKVVIIAEDNALWFENRTVVPTVPLTSDQMAEIILDRDLTFQNKQEVLAALNRSTTRLISVPKPSAEFGDIMADTDGVVLDSLFISLANKAGLLIKSTPGTVALSKNPEHQHLVTTRFQEIFIPDGELRIVNGIWAKCIDMAKETPPAGTVLDVGPKLGELTSYNLAPSVQTFLDSLAVENLYCVNGALNGLWRITDNHLPDSTVLNDFLEQYGVSVGNEFLDFPHFSNPNAEDTTTQFVLPPEIFAADLLVNESLISSSSEVLIDWSVTAPEMYPVSTVNGSWRLQSPTSVVPPDFDASAAALRFTVEDIGFYVPSLQLDITTEDGESFLREVSVPITVAGDFTDTFERGALLDSKFEWDTGPNSPWILSERAPHTGTMSAQSGPVIIGDSPTFEAQDSSTLSIKLDIPQAGSISFAYRVHGAPLLDSLTFTIDDRLFGSWSGVYNWQRVSFPVSAGRHTFEWTYYQSFLGGLGLRAAGIDDVFFPENAMSVSTEPVSTIPLSYQLDSAFPNPANSQSTIQYTIPIAKDVRLVVFDLLGREVARLVDRTVSAGRYEISIDTSDLPAGLYFYRLETGDYLAVKPLVVVR